MVATKKSLQTAHEHEQDISIERVLYIDPEETVTDIRERLKQISRRYTQIALVIHPQTELRSYVAWRLLQRWSQELGKVITIVCTDPHIRAIARSVRFQTISALPANVQR